MSEQRKCPGGDSGASSKSLAGDALSLPSFVVDWQRLAAQVDGAFVVLVETSHGKYRRRVWLTLAAAERAAIKAQDAGHNAVVMLAELKPLYRVEGAAPTQPSLGHVVDAATGQVAL